MNRKLRRYLDETEKTNKKIAELQNYLKSIQVAQKKEEDGEIVRIIRNMKLDPKSLYKLLNGLQDGTMTIQQVKETIEQSSAEAEKELSKETEEMEEIENEEKENR